MASLLRCLRARLRSGTGAAAAPVRGVDGPPRERCHTDAEAPAPRTTTTSGSLQERLEAEEPRAGLRRSDAERRHRAVESLCAALRQQGQERAALRCGATAAAPAAAAAAAGGHPYDTAEAQWHGRAAAFVCRLLEPGLQDVGEAALLQRTEREWATRGRTFRRYWGAHSLYPHTPHFYHHQQQQQLRRGGGSSGGVPFSQAMRRARRRPGASTAAAAAPPGDGRPLTLRECARRYRNVAVVPHALTGEALRPEHYDFSRQLATLRQFLHRRGPSSSSSVSSSATAAAAPPHRPTAAGDADIALLLSKLWRRSHPLSLPAVHRTIRSLSPHSARVAYAHQTIALLRHTTLHAGGSLAPGQVLDEQKELQLFDEIRGRVGVLCREYAAHLQRDASFDRRVMQSEVMTATAHIQHFEEAFDLRQRAARRSSPHFP